MPASDINPTTVWFQDVIAMDATPFIYNVALDPPITQVPGSNPPQLEPEAERTLRALSVAYDLVDVPESINEFDWYAAEVQNGDVTFSVETQANFAATLDDAQWVERKIAALTADDITAIVAAASYPDADRAGARAENLRAPELAELGAESQERRTFRSTRRSRSAPRSRTARSDPGGDINGKQVPGWYGYADQFAFPDPPSPLHGLPWFFASMAESNGLENLVDYANTRFRRSTRGRGERQPEPAHRAGAREVLLDGRGAERSARRLGRAGGERRAAALAQHRHGRVRGHEPDSAARRYLRLPGDGGIDRRRERLAVGRLGVGAGRGERLDQVTHLMPLTSMKQAVTTPISKLLVPLVFADASNVFSQISALQNQPA